MIKEKSRVARVILPLSKESQFLLEKDIFEKCLSIRKFVVSQRQFTYREIERMEMDIEIQDYEYRLNWKWSGQVSSE